ncbi:hypothetical protein HK405_013407 [Cladochytrium tenue]|nr:hypothetical protein HK405_013407 [Cladochytrium tenue]
MPLEGEGKVEDRVDLLYGQLRARRGWIDRLKDANLVLVAAHSQGTPVSTLLLDRLIKEAIVDPKRQRTCLLAMAGISHGPFPHMKSSVIIQYVESDPARQLFEFNEWRSPIATKFRNAMANVLDSGARVVAVGSWYDQVVPLFSATMHAFNHPSIYRAIYIEGVDYTPDFLSHLVVFALLLRNCGISDRGLIVHLSDYVAGNVYGFGTQGHQTLYEETNTYMLAVAWAMGSGTQWKYSSSLLPSYPDLVADHAALPPHDRAAPNFLPPRPLLARIRNPADPARFPILSNRRPPAATAASAATRTKPGFFDRWSTSPSTHSRSPSPNPGNSPALARPLLDLFGHPRVTDPPPVSVSPRLAAPSATAAAAAAAAVKGSSTPLAAGAADAAKTPTTIGFDAPAVGRTNPYWLPFVLAQILTDDRVLADPTLRAALDDLLRLLDGWDPASRPLRDLLYRLEPLRSRL